METTHENHAPEQGTAPIRPYEETGEYRPPSARAPAPPLRRPPRRSLLVAALLSLIPGLGQVYVGYYQLGFLNVAIFASLVSAISFTGDEGGAGPLLGFFLVFFFGYCMVDAIRRASLYNQVLDGVPRVELPEGFRMPAGRGSLFGGAALVLLGFLLALNTVFDVSLAWLQDWWPMAIVAIGAYLVAQAVTDRDLGDILLERLGLRRPE